MKKIYLWPAALAVIYSSSILIIISPIREKSLVALPTPTPTPKLYVEYYYRSPTEIPTKHYQSSSLNIFFSYPSNFSLSERNQQIVLTNNLKVTFNTQKPSLIKVNNFNLTLSLINNVSEYDSTISRGNFLFQKWWNGVEGTGEQNYYLKISDNQWLKITHSLWLDNDVLLSDRQKPDYLTNQRQIELVDSILASLKIPYTCPANERVDCLPGPGRLKAECTADYINWAKSNCPKFKGAAL